MRIDSTRTEQEQKAANMLRLLGFHLKTDYRPKGREFDVYGVLGPLRLAVECKDYAEGTVTTTNIDTFHEKLRMMGNTIGLFIANRFSQAEVDYLEGKGIVHLTTLEQDSFLGSLREGVKDRQQVTVSSSIPLLLGGLKKYTELWYDYIEDWVAPAEMADTILFQQFGILQEEGKAGQLSYKKTETGEEFFCNLSRVRSLLRTSEIVPIESRSEAAHQIVISCSWDDFTGPQGAWDRMVLSGLGLYRIEQFVPTGFATLLKNIAEAILARESWQR